MAKLSRLLKPDSCQPRRSGRYPTYLSEPSLTGETPMLPLRGLCVLCGESSGLSGLRRPLVSQRLDNGYNSCCRFMELVVSAALTAGV